MKAFILGTVLSLFLAATAGAQISNFWLSAPGPPTPSPRPTPSAQLHRAPLQPASGVAIDTRLPLANGFSLVGPWPPLWVGEDEVALLGKRAGHLTLVAFMGDRFSQTRTLIDLPSAGKRTLMDFALGPAHKRFAVAFATGSQLELQILPANGKGAPKTMATLKGDYLHASVKWLDPKTLMIGAVEKSGEEDGSGDQNGAEPPNTRPRLMGHLYLLSPSASSAPTDFDPGCRGAINPLQLHWNAKGSLAIAYGGAAGNRRWYLIEHERSRCSALDLRGLIPVRFLQWGPASARFLFTAVPRNTPAPAALGVFEYSIRHHAAYLIARPAAAAAFTEGTQIVALGSRNLKPPTLARNPDLLMPAEVGGLNAARSELRLVPLGVTVRAASLMNGLITYSAAHKMAIIGLYAPGAGGDFPALLWLSASLERAGVIASGESHGLLIPSWSPDGSKIAVIAGTPEHPLAAILQSPR